MKLLSGEIEKSATLEEDPLEVSNLRLASIMGQNFSIQDTTYATYANTSYTYVATIPS